MKATYSGVFYAIFIISVSALLSITIPTTSGAATAEEYPCENNLYSDASVTGWDASKCFNSGPNGEKSNVPNLPLDQLTKLLGGAGGSTHPACVRETARRRANDQPPPHGDFPCTVPSVSGLSPVNGMCYVLECRAVSYPGEGGGTGSPDIGQELLKGLVGQAMQMIQQAIQGGQGGGGSQGGQASSQEQTSPNVVNDIWGNSQKGVSNDLLGGLGSGSILDSIFGSASSDTEDDENTGDTSDETDALRDTANGDGQESGAGGTTENEATGFFGGSGNEQSLIGRLCGSRPWATGIAAGILPDKFFDGLCQTRGYSLSGAHSGDTANSFADDTEQNSTDDSEPEVRGAGVSGGFDEDGRGIECKPAIARKGSRVELNFSCGGEALAGTAGFRATSAAQTSADAVADISKQYGILCSDDYKALCEVTVIDPQVAIKAQPESVPLGGRTTILWNSQDVEECTVNGLGFTESAPFGGSSTVAITQPTSFKISCTTADGETIEDSVTVELAI